MVADVINIVRAMNNLARTGWMLRGVPPAVCETVSQHSYSTSIIALHVVEKLREKGIDVDPYKTIALALVHDVPEAFTDDILSLFSKRYIPRKKR